MFHPCGDFLHAANTSRRHPKKCFFFNRLHSYHSSSICLREWLLMCEYVLYTLFSVWVCVCVYSVLTLVEEEGGSCRVNLALLSFPQPLYMCNYIPLLIENRALPQSSHNKELLFPCCVYLHVCVCGHNRLLSLSISTHLVIQANSIWAVDYRLIGTMS